MDNAGQDLSISCRLTYNMTINICLYCVRACMPRIARIGHASLSDFFCAVMKLQATIRGVPMHVSSRKLQASAVNNTPFSDSYVFNMGSSMPVAVIHFGQS